MIHHLLTFYGALPLILGVIGIFLPFLSTTPFTLLTATCWIQASSCFHDWLYHHRYFDPIIQDWESNGAVPRKAKLFIIGMMTFSHLLMFWWFPERRWIGVIPSICCSCVAARMWLRSEA